MYYDELDPDLKSPYIKDNSCFANLTSESQLPEYGLKARSLLDTKQMHRLEEIRKRRIPARGQFMSD